MPKARGLRQYSGRNAARLGGLGWPGLGVRRAVRRRSEQAGCRRLMRHRTANARTATITHGGRTAAMAVGAKARATGPTTAGRMTQPRRNKMTNDMIAVGAIPIHPGVTDF